MYSSLGNFRFLAAQFIPVIMLASAMPGMAQSAYQHFEARQTHPICLSPDGTQLLALNTPDARLSVFNISNVANPEPILIAEISVGLEPVSVVALSNDEVWVVNEVSDSISVVSLSQRCVTRTLAVPDEPADVVFAGNIAFVSCTRNNLVRVIDTVTYAELGTVPIQGMMPHALAVNPAGTKVYAACLLSGNKTTILPSVSAPNPPAPTNPALPTAPKTALIVPTNDSRISYTVLDNDVAEIDVATRSVVRYFTGVGTNLFDVKVHPTTGDLFVPNTEALNLVRFEPSLRGHFVDNRLSKISLTSGSVTALDLNAGINYSLLPNPTAQSTALAQPTGINLSTNGATAWVTAFGSDRIAKLDTATGAVLARVDLRTPPVSGPNDSRKMRGPRGLALSAADRIYVLNKLSNSISLVDALTNAVIAEVATGSYDPMPPAIKEGRGFLFDARLSGNGTMSCATCHLDADRDGLAWDLGDPGGDMVTVVGANLAIHDTTPRNRSMHPMKGPMVTQTLRGMQAGAPFHWRGDRANIAAFNPTFSDLLGGTQLSATDIAALEAYLLTLRHPANPNRNLDRTLPATFNGANPTTGRDRFNSHLASHCITCHALPAGSDNNVDDMLNINTTQPIKTPNLRTVYQRAFLDARAGKVNLTGFGLNHDGTGSTHLFPMVHFYTLDNLSGTDFVNVTAFLQCFDTGTAPAVGTSRTLTVANAGSSTLAADLTTLEAQARVANTSDLIAKGRVGNRLRSLYYDKITQRYRTDRLGESTLSRAELLALLSGNDALTFMGLLPGDGARIGGDRNANNVLDGDEPMPSLSVSPTATGFQLHWPEVYPDWMLEESPTLTGNWQPVLDARTSVSGNTQINFSFTPAKRFFRLRRTW